MTLHDESWSWTLERIPEGLLLTVLCGSVGLYERSLMLEPTRSGCGSTEVRLRWSRSSKECETTPAAIGSESATCQDRTLVSRCSSQAAGMDSARVTTNSTGIEPV